MFGLEFWKCRADALAEMDSAAGGDNNLSDSFSADCLINASNSTWG
jgi:hypothetical protein